MVPLLAAILLAGAAGAGPVLVSDACGQDTTTSGESGNTRCAVEGVDRAMRAKAKPVELKVEAEGKLYSVVEGVKYITPDSRTIVEEWWKEFVDKIRELCSRDSAKQTQAVRIESERIATDESPLSCPRCPSSDGDDDNANTTSVRKHVRSAGEHSCQICFDQDHSTVMLPCGHGGLCWDCGLQVYALTEECPMCRTNIKLLVQVDGEKRRYEGEDEFVAAVC